MSRMNEDGEKNIEKKNHFQHVADVVGSWGPIQWQIFIIATIIYIIAPFQNVSLVLYTPKHDFTCQGYWNGVKYHQAGSCYINGTKCNKYDFDKSFYKRTFTSELNLVCDRSWYPSLAQSLHQLGYAISGLAFGYISDNYGRRFTLVLAVVLEIVTGLIQAFTTSLILWLSSRVFFGISAYGRFLNLYLLLMEWVGPELRAPAGILYEIGYSTGYMALPIIFYYTLDYRVIQTSVAIFEVFALIIILLFIPESPRWQLTHNEYEKAENSMLNAAKRKGVLSEEEIKNRILQVKNNLQEQVESEKGQTSQSIIGIWKDWTLLKLTLILYFSWFAQAFIYYASVFNLGQLGRNVFINMFIFGVSSLCSVLFTFVCLTRFGRKNLLITCFLIEGSAFLAMVICYYFELNEKVKLVFAFVATFMCSGGFNILYLYTAETFPTTSRYLGIGTCSIFARVGSIIAPFTKELSISTNVSVTLSLFSFMSFLSALDISLLPETKGRELADTVGQVKKMVPDTLTLVNRKQSRDSSDQI